MHPDYTAFGQAIRQARNTHNMSQQNVADTAADWSIIKHQNVISRWERGLGEPEPRPAEVAELERTLMLTAGELSVHLGWIPAAGVTVEQAITADTELTIGQKRALTAILRELRGKGVGGAHET